MLFINFTGREKLYIKKKTKTSVLQVMQWKKKTRNTTHLKQRQCPGMSQHNTQWLVTCLHPLHCTVPLQNRRCTLLCCNSENTTRLPQEQSSSNRNNQADSTRGGSNANSMTSIAFTVSKSNNTNTQVKSRTLLGMCSRVQGCKGSLTSIPGVVD